MIGTPPQLVSGRHRLFALLHSAASPHTFRLMPATKKSTVTVRCTLPALLAPMHPLPLPLSTGESSSRQQS